MYSTKAEKGFLNLADIARATGRNIHTIRIQTYQPGFPKVHKSEKGRRYWKTKDIEKHYNIKIGG